MERELRALHEPSIYDGSPRNRSRKRDAPMSESSDASDDGVAGGERAGEGGMLGGMGREAESSLSAPFVTPMGRGPAQGAVDPTSQPRSHVRFAEFSSGASEDSEDEQD